MLVIRTHSKLIKQSSTHFRKHCISLNACSRIPNIACPFQTADKQECRWYFGSTVFDSRFFRGQMFVRNKRADQVLRHDIHLQVASLGTCSCIPMFSLCCTHLPVCLNNKIKSMMSQHNTILFSNVQHVHVCNVSIKKKIMCKVVYKFITHNLQ